MKIDREAKTAGDGREVWRRWRRTESPFRAPSQRSYWTRQDPAHTGYAMVLFASLVSPLVEWSLWQGSWDYLYSERWLAGTGDALVVCGILLWARNAWAAISLVRRRGAIVPSPLGTVWLGVLGGMPGLGLAFLIHGERFLEQVPVAARSPEATKALQLREAPVGLRVFGPPGGVRWVKLEMGWWIAGILVLFWGALWLASPASSDACRWVGLLLIRCWTFLTLTFMGALEVSHGPRWWGGLLRRARWLWLLPSPWPWLTFGGPLQEPGEGKRRETWVAASWRRHQDMGRLAIWRRLRQRLGLSYSDYWSRRTRDELRLWRLVQLKTRLCLLDGLCLGWVLWVARAVGFYQSGLFVALGGVLLGVSCACLSVVAAKFRWVRPPKAGAVTIPGSSLARGCACLCLGLYGGYSLGLGLEEESLLILLYGLGCLASVDGLVLMVHQHLLQSLPSTSWLRNRSMLSFGGWALAPLLFMGASLPTAALLGGLDLWASWWLALAFAVPLLHWLAGRWALAGLGSTSRFLRLAALLPLGGLTADLWRSSRRGVAP
jgi:hypothetical protein